MILRDPIRSLRGMARPLRHPSADSISVSPNTNPAFPSKFDRSKDGMEMARWIIVTRTNLLLINLMNRVQRILDRHTLHIPRRHLHPREELQVNLLDRWSGQ